MSSYLHDKLQHSSR